MTVSITIRNPQTKQLQDASGDLGHCRACPAEIVWIVNHRGNRQPYDRQQHLDGTHWPHHSTCPHAKQFRRAQK